MLIFISLFIASAFACDCSFDKGPNLFLLGQTQSQERCQGKILESLYTEYKLQKTCQNSIDINWKCDDKKESKSFPCKTFESMLDAEASFRASETMNDILSGRVIVAAPECADENTSVPETVSKTARFEVKSKDELRKVLAQLGPKYPGQILDTVDKYSVSVSLDNDNSLADASAQKNNSSNDMANTLGMNYIIQKSLDGKGYVVEVSWNSQLYTSYTDPLKPKYTKINGISYTNQNFIEENIGKILLKKVKNGDKVFWSIGGGFHELNKDDMDRNPLISTVNLQKEFHQLVNDQKFQTANGTVKVKNKENHPQSGSEKTVFIEGNIGKSMTIGPLSGQRVRTYVEADAGGRVTGIKDASYANFTGSVNMDTRLWGQSALRLSAGHRSTVMVTGETSQTQFYDVLVGSKHVQVGYRFSDNDRKLASYKNPLPDTYVNRDRDVPDQNNTHSLMLKIAW